MKIAELLKPWVKNHLPDCDISGLHNDSRQIRTGFLFFAYPGAVSDGRFFCKQAVSAGAVAILYEPNNWPLDCSLPDGILSIPLPGLAKQLAAIASRFYGEPTKTMQITGVTGTNGKTTISYQLAQAHDLLSTSAAYIGTLGQGKVSALHPLDNTTPDALCLQNLFYDYQKESIKQVSMEVSSHALAQQRVDNINFRQAIFTNLTLDHLDYHHTMEAYAAAKALLFKCSSLQWAIVNQDDSYASIMKNSLNKSCQLITYGINEGSDVCALSWDVTLTGTFIEVKSPWGKHALKINALGFFNIYNALAVFTSLMVSGYEIDKVISVMSKLYAAPGRMEIVAQRPYVIVDYAHTPDALENVLITLNDVKKGRILLVFGCGGDRDKTKRPIMGAIAARLADVVIITSDNPRTEDPLQIISDIEQGITMVDKPIYAIADREAAIAKAISLANQEDIILVAGKGHEDYQQIGHKRYAFCDQEIIKRLILENQGICSNTH
jgi:UDP-N-acetylmuramoyl-L-alanyl-D-glutamate--2,6-diaminopimelate ligase